MQAFDKAGLITDVPELKSSHPKRWHRGCRPGMFEWQGIDLNFLGPEQPEPGNNGSCVLQLFDGHHRVLLPGDIELAAEVALLHKKGSLESDVLLAPHHAAALHLTLSLSVLWRRNGCCLLPDMAIVGGFPKRRYV